MAAVSQKVIGLIGGVSQQPDSLKLPGQLRECTNYYPDPTFGLLKRPGVRLTRRLQNSVAGGSWFFINQGLNGKLIMQVGNNGTIRLWDAQSGIQQTVNALSGTAQTYATHNTKSDLELLQINDYIFFLNRLVKVAASATNTATQNPYGFVSINTVGYSAEYSIKLDATTFTYTTPSNTTGDIVNLVVKAGGSGYTNGTYTNVPLKTNTTTSPGAGATANVTISGGVVTAVTINSNGYAYRVSDELEFATNASVGGTGTGATFEVREVISDIRTLTVDLITNSFVSQINAGGVYTATAVGSYIHIKRVNNADFAIEARGGLAGTAITAYKGKVESLQDLPKQFLNGTVIQVAADQNSEADDYYVKFVTSNGGAQGAGSWEETVAPGISIGLNPTTMPHALIKEANGTYTFRELSAAAAGSYVTSTTVTGIPSAVSVVSTGNARWDIGQSFPVYGGSGINLRLEVTSINSSKEITGIKISRAGQGYTALDSVTNAEGDTFQITTVGSATVPGTTWATQYWTDREVGDLETNPNPSFVGFPISGISFFKNRLVMMSESNVICSQAGDYLNFFASTVITIVDNDPIDISAGATLKTQFRYAIQQADGLLIFADNSQYILQTNSDAFSIRTAELNLISSYSQSITINPVDLGSTIAFVEENPKSTLVTEIQVVRNQQPQSFELTKIIPSYIPTGIIEFRNSLSASVFGLRSIQEPNALYLFRYYTQGNERQMASWFKWVFPAPIRMIDFLEDEVFFVLDGDSTPILGSLLLLTDSPSGAVEFDGTYVDLRLDLVDYNPSTAYDSVNDVTKIFFKEGAELAAAQPCVVTITPNNSGFVVYPSMEYNAAAPAGQKYYVELEGDQTAEWFALGYQIESTSLLPNFYVVRDKVSDNMNIPVIHRVRLYSHNSGPFTAVLNVVGRNAFTLDLPQVVGDVYLLNEAPILRTAENIIPIMASGRYVELELNCDAPFPLALVSMTWEGTYNNKGIKAV